MASIQPTPGQPPAGAPASATPPAQAFAPAAYGLATPATYANHAAPVDIAARIQQIAQAAAMAAQARQASMLAFDQGQTAQEGAGRLALGYTGADIARAGDSAYQDSGGEGTSLASSLARSTIAGQQMENEAALQHNEGQYQQEQNAIQQQLVPEHAAEYAGMANYYKSLAPLQQAKIGLAASQAGAQAATAQKSAAAANLLQRQAALYPTPKLGLPTAATGGM